MAGGTAHRILSRQPEAVGVDFDPLSTLDIDLVVAADRPVSGNELAESLRSRGFEEELTGTGQHACARYRWGDSPTYLQFLASRIGSSTGVGARPLSIGGLLVERVPHLGILLAGPVRVELSAIGGALAVYVANPASFILQKVLIAPDRARQGMAVAAKDLLYIYDTSQMFPPHLELSTRFAGPAWAAMTRPERGLIDRWIRRLETGPDAVCDQAAFIARAIRASPPRSEDVAATCLEVVRAIRSAALGQ